MATTKVSYPPVLPEFYTLSFLEKQWDAKGDDLKHKVVSSNVGGLHEDSVALSSRAAKQKHDTIQRLLRVETKPISPSLTEKVVANMRASKRKVFSRGHMIPSPAPGKRLTMHPKGASPVVLRNDEIGSRGRNASPNRPRTASEQSVPRGSPILRTVSRLEEAGKYARRTARTVLSSRGVAIAEDCSRSSWAFKAPLNIISCTRPSSFASSLAYAPLPNCAECILSEGPYASLAGIARRKINEKLTQEDRLYLVSTRNGSSLRPSTSPVPSAPPFSIDYSPSSPSGKPRDVWRKTAISSK